MKITKFSIIVPLVCAVVGSDNVCAQDTADGSAVCTVGSLELISTGSSPQVFRIIEEARPDEPNAVPVPKFTLRTRDNRFMLSIGGKINPIMGYDIGNNLYNVDGAGSNFIPGDIPVPALQGHKGDFFINALNGDVDFTMAGLGGTPNRITGYIKIGTDGISKGIKLKRAYITYRRVTAGLRHSTATDNEALQPNTIDPQGPNGDFCTTNYQLAYNSPSYSGFSWAAAIEMPSFCNSNGIYRGHDFQSWHGRKVDADVDQLIPDVPAWVQYEFSDNNRLRLTGLLRGFAYQDMVNSSRQTVLGWGAMVSGNFSFWKPLVFNFQAVYGKGIGNYIQDLAGRPLSFTPKSSELGKMEANPMMGLVFGASWNISSKWQFNAVGSYARVWNVGNYAIASDYAATDANGTQVRAAGNGNYRYGIYAVANVFYHITSYLDWGLEYCFGRHETYGLGGANDSRIQTQLAFTF